MTDQTRRLAEQIFLRMLDDKGLLRAVSGGSEATYEVQVQHAYKVARLSILVANAFDLVLQHSERAGGEALAMIERREESE